MREKGACGLAKRAKSINKMKWTPYLFIAPAVIYLFIVTIIPALMALPISFTNWSALSPTREFVGFDNYIRLFKDPVFYTRMFTMMKFFIFVPLQMGIGLLAAVLLNVKVKGIKLFRVLFYAPVITSTVAVALLFEWFYQPTFGLFNNILTTLGFSGIGWINDPKTAVISVIIFMVWKGFGASMIIYLAGLQDIQQDVKEASDIDGANAWQKFRYITLPLLRPAHLYLLVINVIHVFMIFQETYMLPGPMKSTNTIVNYIFEKGFESAEMGYACAMSFILFIIVFIVTMIQYKVTKMDIE